MEKVDCVAANHFMFFRVRHAGEVLVDDAQRLGPVRLLMWKIGAPHEAIDIDLVAQLDADAIELKAPVEIFANEFTGRTAERLQPEQTMSPVMMAVITDIGALQEEWNPADLVFREEDTELRKAIEES